MAMKLTARQRASIREHARELGGVAQGFREAARKAEANGATMLANAYLFDADAYEYLAGREWASLGLTVQESTQASQEDRS